jgi:hypothetical protein
MKSYGPSRALLSLWRPNISLKLGLVGATMLIGLALTLAGAEASGDPYGDVVGSTGNVDGDLGNVTGAADGSIVQVGAGGSDGSVTVWYTDNVAFDGPGVDIRIHTLDTEAPAEATIEVGSDGVGFTVVGNFFDDAGAIDIDLGALGLSFAESIRVTYVSGEQPGFDVDAIEALNQTGTDGIAIILAPPSNDDPGFAEHRVSATVTDSTDSGDVPLVGIQVTFAVVSGPTAGTTGTALTDASGRASFGWNGASSGVDEVLAWLDFDGSGTRDEGEPAEDATKLWNGDTGTIELIDLDGDALNVGDLVQIVVEDRDLDVSAALDTIAVVITSTSDATGISVLLTETGEQTGIFSAVIELAEVSDEAAGQLAAIVGDEVTGSYDDAFDATGADPAPVTASLTVVDPLEDDTLVEDGKVTVCHRPSGNPGNQHTLNVGASALDAHLGHGDVEGDCADAPELEEPTKQEQAEERKAERDAAFCERKGDDHPRCRDE